MAGQQCILTIQDNTPLPDENNGCSDASAGNPINTGTGNKFQLETDYVSPDNSGLAFKRAYNSTPDNIYRKYWPSLVGGNVGEVNPATGYWIPNIAPANYDSGANKLRSSWKHSYERRVSTSYVGAMTTGVATLYRPDGKAIRFTLAAGIWTPDRNIADSLTRLSDVSGNTTGWTVAIAADSSVEYYAADGKLTSIFSRAGLTQSLTYANGLLSTVTDSFGRQLSFAYDSFSRMTSMTDPTGKIYTYEYNSSNFISAVIYPDDTPGNSTDNPRRNYLYNETGLTGNNLPTALTGIVDENGSRFATWRYDNEGRAISSEHAGGAEKVTVSYSANFSASVVSDFKDSSSTPNANRNYGFQTLFNVVKNTGVSQPCASGCGASAAAITYHSYWGYVSSRTDYNGNMTTYTYDLPRLLENKRVEGLTSGGATTPQTRTISTEWHANWRLPKRMAEPKRITTYVYNGDGGAYCAPTTSLVNGIPIGVLCSKTVTETTDANGSLGFSATAVVPVNARTWAYTYNSLGQMLSSNGPRTDVTDLTNYTYYANTDVAGNYRIGDLNTVSNALGHVTTLSAFDAHGRPKTITDANGLVTQLTYTPRGWLNSRSVGALLHPGYKNLCTAPSVIR